MLCLLMITSVERGGREESEMQQPICPVSMQDQQTSPSQKTEVCKVSSSYQALSSFKYMHWKYSEDLHFWCCKLDHIHNERIQKY